MMPLKQKQIMARHLVFLLAVGLALAGCSTDQFGGSLVSGPTADAKAKPAKPEPPPFNMGGRWMLSSPGAGLCGMTFTTRGNGSEGAIAPEGGCPGDFFTSRHWTFDSGSLVITNHKGKTLARLASSTPPGTFQGTGAGGLPVTLTR